MTSFFPQFGPNSGYVDEMYRRYLKDPSLVEDEWAQFFKTHAPFGDAGKPSAVQPARESRTSGQVEAAAVPDERASIEVQAKVSSIVTAYRSRGHLAARVNPLPQRAEAVTAIAELDPANCQFSREALAREYLALGFRGRQRMRLGQLLKELREVYGGPIGFEYMHLDSPGQREWLREHIERVREPHYGFTKAQRLRILQKLVDGEEFENGLHKKYVGHKRFSLQGADTVLPMIDIMLDEAGRAGVQEVLFGMAHRGRVTVLHNILGKPLAELFSEFEDQNMFTVMGSGDMKYHLGFDSVYQVAAGEELKISLTPNPSHLEFASPVVLGICRARQTAGYDGRHSAAMPLLIHGDAAFAGEGIAPETLNLSALRGYSVGGALHLVINNQIGFTTTPKEARSTVYCTDFAKAVQAPIFHVNAEDPEAACWVMQLAFQFRRRFGRDAVIDLYCYRRYGHNEADDPSFTQPQIYADIEKKQSIAGQYAAALVEAGLIKAADVTERQEVFRREFNQVYDRMRQAPRIGDLCPTHGKLHSAPVATGVNRRALEKAAAAYCDVPSEFAVHPKLRRILEKRRESLAAGEGLDWGFTEILALGTLLQNGVNVRLSGQDSGRGTFGQRHLILVDYENGQRIVPLDSLNHNAGRIEVYNSPLSEAAVLGFEFGYSTAAEKSLVLWEAQFGDFANVAQVIIDQFISCSEQKWDLRSGVVLLLPHGYEGQGPEHSSGRLERFLQLCADGNMSVCYPSTAAQYFHLLRRQGLSEIKRPLVVMTPKSYLRSTEAACRTADLLLGTFRPVLIDDLTKSGEVENLIFVTGKMFYDVRSSLIKLPDAKSRILRIEQLYPFPLEELREWTAGTNPKHCVWIQEEPINMGAWWFVESYLRRGLDLKPECISRPLSASTAAGSSSRHGAEQKGLISRLLQLIGQ